MRPRDVRKIARARRAGCRRPWRAMVEARRVGIPFYVLCAFLEQESSGGRNIFGHDTMKCGHWIKGKRCTHARYRAYKAQRATCGMQGVGPMQLTWWEFQDRADALGGCWRPRHNIRVGTELLAEYRGDLGSWHAAAKRYNGSEEYAVRNDTLRSEWRGIVLRDAS